MPNTINFNCMRKITILLFIISFIIFVLLIASQFYLDVNTIYISSKTLCIFKTLTIIFGSLSLNNLIIIVASFVDTNKICNDEED